MARRIPTKRSKHELKRLIEAGVHEVCGFPRPGLWFCVDEVEVSGRPPSRVRVWATLNLLPEGSPFCCSEPMCHLGLSAERLKALNEWVRKEMGFTQKVSIEFGDRVGANVADGVRLTVFEKMGLPAV